MPSLRVLLSYWGVVYNTCLCFACCFSWKALVLESDFLESRAGTWRWNVSVDSCAPQVLRSFGEGKMFFTARFHPADDKQNVIMGGCADKKIHQWDSDTGDTVQVPRSSHVLHCDCDTCQITDVVQYHMAISYLLEHSLQSGPAARQEICTVYLPHICMPGSV